MQTDGDFCSEERQNTEARSVAKILPTAKHLKRIFQNTSAVQVLEKQDFVAFRD